MIRGAFTLQGKRPNQTAAFHFHLGTNFYSVFDHDQHRDGPQIGWPAVMLELSARNPEKVQKLALAEVRF